MKNHILLFAMLLAFTISSCSTNRASDVKGTDTSNTQKTATTYTCPMHPEVISDKPGKCPKCKMPLVEKENQSADEHSGHQH